MLTLITGLPGSSKTLNTIKMVDNEPKLSSRPVYYYNIKELERDWIELSEDEVSTWYELPDNSLIILDEAQRFFPPRKVGTDVPAAVQYFDTHRHRGLDIYLITQYPTLVDATLRKFVGRHLHFERQFGSKIVRCLEWNRCVNDPYDDHKLRNEAVSKQVPLDKKYFGVYKSAEVHTHKMRLPWKVFVPIALLAFCIISVLSVINKYKAKGNPVPEQETSINISPVQSAIADDSYFRTSKKEKELTYLELYTPRIEGVPSSAPIYDGITQPKQAPKTYCVINNDKDTCKCYTQQMTIASVPDHLCRTFVTSGIYDPTISKSYYEY